MQTGLARVSFVWALRERHQRSNWPLVMTRYSAWITAERRNAILDALCGRDHNDDGHVMVDGRAWSLLPVELVDYLIVEFAKHRCDFESLVEEDPFVMASLNVWGNTLLCNECSSTRYDFASLNPMQQASWHQKWPIPGGLRPPSSGPAITTLGPSSPLYRHHHNSRHPPRPTRRNPRPMEWFYDIFPVVSEP